MKFVPEFCVQEQRACGGPTRGSPHYGPHWAPPHRPYDEIPHSRPTYRYSVTEREKCFVARRQHWAIVEECYGGWQQKSDSKMNWYHQKLFKTVLWFESVVRDCYGGPRQKSAKARAFLLDWVKKKMVEKKLKPRKGKNCRKSIAPTGKRWWSKSIVFSFARASMTFTVPFSRPCTIIHN